MKDNERVIELLEKGYRIEMYWPFSSITAESVDNWFSKLNLEIDLEELLKPSNKDKFLIFFRNFSTGERVEIVTSDKEAIKKVIKQSNYQKEPIGTLIRAKCAALGGRSPDERIFHLNDLINSLDGIFEGWEFTLGNCPAHPDANCPLTFEISVQIDSINELDRNEVIDKLQVLLDYLAISLNVGFAIQHYDFALIPRMNPTVSTGPQERMLFSLNSWDKEKMKMFPFFPEKVKIAARGINQTYIEKCMPSRISMLWATVENIFDSTPDPLLSKDEIAMIIKTANSIETLKSDKKRLNQLKGALSNPNRLPVKGRNERMAENIAPLLGLSAKETLDKIRKASYLRGMNVHQLLENWDDLEESEKFLQDVLLNYLRLRVPPLSPSKDLRQPFRKKLEISFQ
ncbi:MULTISPECIES: hypothetical protein [Methanobacterium]|uniref:Uncharacterized protein n=1 Tax=Methanobacterium veterum TaxID=408577 RepID=A0A9E5DIQ2_9EURY|nr:MULTISPECIES: hypothetical protein [Methanobacterium]MCZ3364408.1 hypothetical protein [Methanobacterium veterum]MCZ3372159.1 hypothetical protein [Methanobacterium veterum]